MRKIISLLFLGTCYLVLGTSAKAVCPVCTIAVAGGLGVSRYLGIDDTIIGLWVGALILSSSFWLADWLKRKGVKVKKSVLDFIIAIIFYLITLVPLYLTAVIGHPYNTLYGINKLIFGTILGSVIFLGALILDKQVRKYNGGQLFVYQKVVFPVISLILISLILYFVLR